MPPACLICGTHQGGTVRGCNRCGMRDKHRHVFVVNRWDQPQGDAVLCAPCMDALGWGQTSLLDALSHMGEAS